jgi:hypothetical protein
MADNEFVIGRKNRKGWYLEKDHCPQWWAATGVAWKSPNHPHAGKAYTRLYILTVKLHGVVWLN